MVNAAHKILVQCLGAAIILAYALMAYQFPYAYIWATYEDLYGEWMQFYLFVGAFVASIVALRTPSRYRWFFVLLAVATFYVFMEEISWGQRLLGISSPEFFKEHNLQGETNLHNFLVGPFSTNLKQVIEYLVALALVEYGLVYPLMLRYDIWPAGLLDRLGVAAPPLYLWMLFSVAAFLELGLLSFNEAEIAEILIGLALAAMALHYAFALRSKLEVHSSSDWSTGAAPRLAILLGLAFTVVLVCAFVTTELLYLTDRGKARTDNRIENGLEKFAGRYRRYDRGDVVIKLYERLHEIKPRSTSTLRQLARAHLRVGEKDQHNAYLQEALAIGHERLTYDPLDDSANRSLARTYRLLDEDEKADQQLRFALATALKKAEQRPNSAAAAYSLGLTWSLLGEKQKQLEQYQRATTLRPTSSKYRKAWLRLKIRLDGI